MFKYVLKRIALVFVTFFIIMTMCFILIKLLQPEKPMLGAQAAMELARREALGYNKPILVQYAIYLRNILTKWDWGTSWEIDYMAPVNEVIFDRLLPTVLINVYSMLFSVPFGIIIGIYAALKKNRWQDHLISTWIMIFVSVPSYVYAFIVQYFLSYKTGWFPLIMSSYADAGGTFFSWTMFRSMVLPVLALSFSTIASLARYTRAELTEVLTSDFMLLARTKGLTSRQATTRHALRNAMVPILPMIISMFIGVLDGSLIIEKIFAVPGVGGLYLNSINLLDYDVFMAVGMFYTFINLSSMIVIDLSYGFIDPRVRMGER